MQIGTLMMGTIIVGKANGDRRMLWVEDIRDVHIYHNKLSGDVVASLEVVYKGTTDSTTITLYGDQADGVVRFLDGMVVDVEAARRKMMEEMEMRMRMGGGTGQEGVN